MVTPFDYSTGQRHFAGDGQDLSDKPDHLNLTIMVVEDSEDTRYVLGLALRNEGYRVVTAADGREAVETAVRVRPDLILMDLNLPELDGLAATQQIREHDELRHVPILAITAFDTYGIKEAALEAGCNKYLIKPLDLDYLGELLRSILH
jgi:two-component system, cell cycle response regulator DivK